MDRQYLTSHCRLATRDLDEARAAVNRLWERHRSVLRHGRHYAVRWHQANLLRTSLSYVRNSSEVQVESVVGRSYHLTFQQSGSVIHRLAGREVVARPSNMVIHYPGQALQLDFEPCGILLLSFDADSVDKMLLRRFDRLPANDARPEAWPIELPVDLPAVSSLHSLCRWMGHELDQPATPLLSSPTVTASFERTLLTLFVDGLAARMPAVGGRSSGMSDRQLTQIDAWLDANFARPIGVEDMANVAQTSVRTLQNAYRRARGHTPHQAIQRRRLLEVRQILSRPAPQTTVTDAAFDVGFFHLGRFAAAYAAMFDERPSQTLARSRAEWFETIAGGSGRRPASKSAVVGPVPSSF